MKKIYEFLVWDNCNNNCQFCWQRENPRIYNFEQRRQILMDVIKFINSSEFIKGSHVLICGGEIFDKPSDFIILQDFFKDIINLMNNNIIDLLYVNTNLIYLNINALYDFLEKIKQNNLFHRLKFTSSYDIEGRFKSEHDRQIMLTNLKTINNQYNLNTVVNTILTKPCCDAILNNEFNVKEFMEEYKCWVNLVPYIVLNDKLTADRVTIFKTLYHVDKQIPYLEQYISNIGIKQDKLLYKFENGKFNFCSCDIAECGHSINFRKYSKECTCFCCDLEEACQTVQ